MTKEKKKYLLNLASIIAIFFLCGSGGFVNTTIQSCMEAWPEVPAENIRLISTLPSLVSVIFMLFVSRLTDRFSYRQIMIFACFLMIAGGSAPFFYTPNWGFVIFCRIVCGIAMGLLGLRNALLLRSVTAEDKDWYVGLSNLANNSANILTTLLAGKLTGISWKHAFLLYLFGLVIMAFVIPNLLEPEHQENTRSRETEKKGLDPLVYAYCVIIFIISLVLYPLLSGMSSFVSSRNIGSSSVTGLLIAGHNAGGFISGLHLKQMNRWMGKHAVLFAIAACMTGQILSLHGNHVVLMLIGTFLTGVGYFLMYADLIIYTGNICSDRELDRATTLELIIMQVGIFLSSYYISFSHSIMNGENDVISSWRASLFIYIVLFVLCFCFRRKLFHLSEKTE